MSSVSVQSLVPLKWSKAYEGSLKLIENTPVNCLLVEGADRPSPAPAGLAIVSKDELKDVTLISDAKWPSIQATSGDRSSAGPTGMPWVDANGWMIRLAQARNPGNAVWVDAKPPEDAGPNSLSLAVADSAAFGARWIISPGEQFPSTDTWQKLVRALDFFEKHAEWRDFEAAAVLGVLSDFTGPNEFLATECLNLIPRRQLCYKILLKSRTKTLDGLAAVIYAEEKPPEGEVLAMLEGWVRQGGLLLAPAGTKLGDATNEQSRDYTIFRLGKGRVAVPQEPWSDPYIVAQDAHLLLSRGQDLLRLFNYGAMNSYYVRSRDGKRAVVHLLNYSRREAAHLVTLAMGRKYRRGRFLTFESEVVLKPAGAARGVEFALPPFDVYAAIEMET